MYWPYYKIEHSDINIWVNIFFQIKVLKNYPVWPQIMTIYVIQIPVVMTNGS